MSPQRHARRKRALAIAAALFVAILILRPADRARGVAPDPYFAAMNAELKAHGTGEPCAVIDLDRLDHNIAAVRATIRGGLALRVVVKSLPSVELLRYVLERAGTRKLMIFDGAQIGYLLRSLDGRLDILMGKPMPAAVARAALIDDSRAAASVQWLVDTRARLDEYQRVARELKQPLRINLEIDVGLHRGGATSVAELQGMLDAIRASAGALKLAGLMGYDGHVAHVPGELHFGEERGRRIEFRKALARYSDFMKGAGLKADDLTLDGGGSHTYAYFDPAVAGPDDPINDVSMGSGFLKPVDFDDASLSAHQPAVFLAMPILKKIATPSIPFLDALWPVLSWWNRNVERGFYLYGGPWDAPIEFPPGLAPAWFHETQITNLLPNQELLSGSARVQANVGDFVIVRPRESDAIAVFNAIYALRGGRIFAKWAPFSVLN